MAGGDAAAIDGTDVRFRPRCEGFACLTASKGMRQNSLFERVHGRS
jgi:hypothetical protein